MIPYTHFMNLSNDKLETHTKEAWENLESLFSVYSKPVKVEHCPCGCITERDIKRLNQGYLGFYLSKAMTTWGTKADFGYYLPRVLRYFFEADRCLDGLALFDRIQMLGLSFEQRAAIVRYADSKSREIIAKSVRKQVSKIRIEVSEWLKNPETVICINTYHPFDMFSIVPSSSSPFFSPYAHFCSFDHLVEIKRLLNFWPANDLDLYACAHFIGDKHNEPRLRGDLFLSEVEDWVARCKAEMQRLLAETKGQLARDILSEAIEKFDFLAEFEVCQSYIDEEKDIFSHEEWYGMQLLDQEEKKPKVLAERNIIFIN